DLGHSLVQVGDRRKIGHVLACSRLLSAPGLVGGSQRFFRSSPRHRREQPREPSHTCEQNPCPHQPPHTAPPRIDPELKNITEQQISSTNQRENRGRIGSDDGGGAARAPRCRHVRRLSTPHL